MLGGEDKSCFFLTKTSLRWSKYVDFQPFSLYNDGVSMQIKVIKTAKTLLRICS